MNKSTKTSALSKFKLHYELIEGDPMEAKPNARSKTSINKILSKHFKGNRPTRGIKSGGAILRDTARPLLRRLRQYFNK